MEVYALVTAAHNEERYIEKTLRSVTSQTVLPAKWIIVSDGSTDGTDEIVRKYEAAFPFIRLLRREEDSKRDFASKVFALNAGRQLIESRSYRFVGHLDADVSFGPNYFHDLFCKFESEPALGLAGGFIYEESNGQFISQDGIRTASVAGAVQTFRSECYREVGPFLPIEYGGEDWYAEVAARMSGWRVEAFPELEVRHHRPAGTVGGLLRSWYRAGFMDYYIGSHPAFEIAKLVRHISYRPPLLGSLARLSGFIAANLGGEKRMVSPAFVSFLRMEQMHRLRDMGYDYLAYVVRHT